MNKIMQKIPLAMNSKIKIKKYFLQYLAIIHKKVYNGLIKC